MTGRQKFLLSTAYKYVPQYEIKFDRDRDVMSLRVWLDDCHFLAISDVPSLAGTNQFQVRYCEQTRSWQGPSIKVGPLDNLFGKKCRNSGEKFIVVDAYRIVDVLEHLEFVDKSKRNALHEKGLWFSIARDCYF